MKISAGQKYKDIDGEVYLVEGLCTDVRTGMIMVIFRLFPLTLDEELHKQIFVLPFYDFVAETESEYSGQKYAFELVED